MQQQLPDVQKEPKVVKRVQHNSPRNMRISTVSTEELILDDIHTQGRL